MDTIKPLDNKTEDLALINNIKENNSSADYSVNKLLDKYGAFYTATVSGHCSEHFSDIINDKYFVLYNSVKSFDPSKDVSFLTWFGSQTYYYCLNYKNSLSKNQYNNTVQYVETPEQDDKLSISASNELNSHATITYSGSEKTSTIIDDSLHILKENLNERAATIFKYKVIEGYKWREISSKVGLSTTQCNNIYNASLECLKNNLDKIVDCEYIKPIKNSTLQTSIKTI